MSSTLCIDFGNTRLKAAILVDGNCIEEFFLNAPIAQLSEILKLHQPTYSILSSVIDNMPDVDALLNAHTLFHKLSHTSKLPFTTPAAKPETIGPDRLALCAAAVQIFPHQHNLVIAMGSCITYNYINSAHEFLGGSISPGMEMRFKSMHQFTAKLPEVKPSPLIPFIGYDTGTNLQSGVLFGIAYEIDGFIDAYKKRYSNFNTIFTGGAARYLAPHIKNKIFADPFLIYKGLYAICKENF